MFIFSSIVVLISLLSSARSFDCGNDALVQYGSGQLPENVPYSALLKIDYPGNSTYCTGVIVSPKELATYGCNFYPSSSVSIFFNKKSADGLSYLPEETPSITIAKPHHKKVGYFIVLYLEDEIVSNVEHAPICVAESLPEEFVSNRVYIDWEKVRSNETPEGYVHRLVISPNLRNPSASIFKNTNDNKWYLSGVEFYHKTINGIRGTIERYETPELIQQLNSAANGRVKRYGDFGPSEYGPTDLDSYINDWYTWMSGW